LDAALRATLDLAATLPRAFAEDAESAVGALGPVAGGLPVERLVQARSRVAVQPDLAWPTIDDFRRFVGIPTGWPAPAQWPYAS
jgi:hypothetical protein